MNQNPNSDVIQPDRAKDPILILILALFLGPIAYFVVGQWQKGLTGIGVWLAGAGIMVLTCGIGSILVMPIAIAVVVDNYLQAKSLKDGHAIGQWTFFGNHL